MDLRVCEELKYAGRRHSPGSILRDVPITTGRRLVARGLAEQFEGAEVIYIPENPLPEDLPGREALFEAGYVDVAEIPLESAELVALDGIGKKTAERIIEALKAVDESGDEGDE